MSRSVTRAVLGVANEIADMIIEVKAFRERVKADLPNLVTDLQATTGRYGDEEAESWRNSLPKLADVFSSSGFDPLHLYFNGTGALSLEYQLPAASSWCDVVLLGKKGDTPGAVIIELKHWQTSTDKPGPVEGLIEHFGNTVLHPSDQVRGYAEYCRRYHSAVLEQAAEVKGCVLFTRDTVTRAYHEAPNHELTSSFPCFSLAEEDASGPFPNFIGNIIDAPDLEFATAFETGRYKQDRGFVQQIGEQILDPNNTPFELLDNQRRAFALCKAQVNASLFAESSTKGKKVIVIEGPPGSGKSVVAAKIWAALATDERLPDGPIVFTSTSASQNSNWTHLFAESAAEVAGTGVVKKATSYTPITTHTLGKLRKQFNDPDLFKDGENWRTHLKTLRALGTNFGNGTHDGEYLVSVVDEAHALINSEHRQGRGQFGFVTGLGPQAYHIMRVSQVSIFLLDPRQSFRTRENTTVSDLKNWASELDAEYVDVSLAGSQFRCAGSKEYVDWVEAILRNDPVEKCRVLSSAWHHQSPPSSSKIIEFPVQVPSSIVAEDTMSYRVKPKHRINSKYPGPLDFKIFDSPQAMEDALRAKVDSGRSARLLAPYARKWATKEAANPHDLPPSMQDFCIPYIEEGIDKTWTKVWNFVPSNGSDYATFIQGKNGSRIYEDPLCEVGCPYAVRGFDWDYVGILWMSDLVYKAGGWEVNPEHVHETGISSLRTPANKEVNPKGPHHINLLEAVVQSYRILMTRPIKGIYLWFEDENTRAYVESTIGENEN